MQSRRRWFRSIRTRIVVGYVVLITIALAATLLIVQRALETRFDRDVDRRLAGEVEQLERVIAEGDPATGGTYVDAEVLFDTYLRRVLPADDDAFFSLVEGNAFLRSFDPPARLFGDRQFVDELATVTTSTFRTVSTPAGRARLLIVPVVLDENSGTFVAAAFTDNARSELADVVRVVGLVGGVVLLVTALVAGALATRITRPIRRLTDLAQSVTEADLSARIPAGREVDDELAELSDTFNGMMARLEGVFVAQRRFIDDAAHELRTPITIIQGHLDVLDDDPVERQETVAVLNDELARMNRYVDDLLVLAQAEQPDFLRVRPVDLDVLLDAVMVKVSRLGGRWWVIDERCAGSATIDDQRITQVLLNLCENAVRHTEFGDEIGVGVGADEHRLRLSVRDTGPGVDPRVMNDIFERHIRGASSRTEGGIGIGLSIVDAIAVAHRGRVIVESDPDRGATFIVDIERHLT